MALNDVFGTPFNGAIDRNWPAEDRLRLGSGSHNLVHYPGTPRFKVGSGSRWDEAGSAAARGGGGTQRPRRRGAPAAPTPARLRWSA